MAFPTTPTLDNFDRADTPFLGANWNEVGTAFSIASNKCAGAGFAYWQPSGVALFVLNGEIYATITGSNIHYLEFRMALATNRANPPTTTGNWSGYFCEFSISADTVKMFKYNGASVTQIGSTVSTTVNSGQQIGCDFNGSTLRSFVAGTQVGSDFTDSTYADAGVLTLEGTTGSIFDDFGGGPFPTVTRQPRSPAVNFQDPGVFMKRLRSGISVPRLWVPDRPRQALA